MTNKCSIFVPPETCTLTFGEGKYTHTEEIGATVRGESVLVDRDKDGKIIRIELLGSPAARKPCQEGETGQDW